MPQLDMFLRGHHDQQALELYRQIDEHPWSRRLTQHDATLIGDMKRSLINLSNDLHNLREELKQRLFNQPHPTDTFQLAQTVKESKLLLELIDGQLVELKPVGVYEINITRPGAYISVDDADKVVCHNTEDDYPITIAIVCRGAEWIRSNETQD